MALLETEFVSGYIVAAIVFAAAAVYAYLYERNMQTPHPDAARQTAKRPSDAELLNNVSYKEIDMLAGLPPASNCIAFRSPERPLAHAVV